MRVGRTAVSAGLAVTVILLDFISKRWALAALSDGTTFDLFGGFVPITLAFNRGAAFGLSIGNDPRWIFIPVTILAIVFLVALIREAQPGDSLRVTASSLILGGALGNLYDRIRWNRGVVDFIGPIDLGLMDWPIFNVADAAITCGAILLAISFWREGAAERTAAELAVDTLHENREAP